MSHLLRGKVDVSIVLCAARNLLCRQGARSPRPFVHGLFQQGVGADAPDHGEHAVCEPLHAATLVYAGTGRNTTQAGSGQRNVTYEYDEAGRRIGITTGSTLANVDSHVVGYEYDERGHITKMKPTLGPATEYREAHQLIEDINEARELGQLRKYRAQLKATELLLIDDLFLRKLPTHAGDELADVLMSRYEKASTLITSNRPIDDWTRLLGDVVVVTPLLDRLMHHGHLLKFEGKSWRLKEAAARVAKHTSSN